MQYGQLNRTSYNKETGGHTMSDVADRVAAAFEVYTEIMEEISPEDSGVLVKFSW